jgi:hypothetical protein
MPLWSQYLLIGTAVLGSSAYLIRQGWKSLAGKRSRLGSCCAKGCSAQQPRKSDAPQPIQFLPVEMLGRRK